MEYSKLTKDLWAASVACCVLPQKTVATSEIT